MRLRAVYWGRENPQGGKGEGALFTDRSERESEKQDREWSIGFAQYTVVRGSPQSYWKSSLPLLEYIWKEYFASPKTKSSPEVIDSCSAAGDRGVHRAQVTRLQLFYCESQ